MNILEHAYFYATHNELYGGIMASLLICCRPSPHILRVLMDKHVLGEKGRLAVFVLPHLNIECFGYSRNVFFPCAVVAVCGSDEAFIRQPVSVLCMVIGNPVLHGLAAGRDHGIFEGVSIADQLLVEQIHLLIGRYDVLNGHGKTINE